MWVLNYVGLNSFSVTTEGKEEEEAGHFLFPFLNPFPIYYGTKFGSQNARKNGAGILYCFFKTKTFHFKARFPFFHSIKNVNEGILSFIKEYLLYLLQ